MPTYSGSGNLVLGNIVESSAIFGKSIFGQTIFGGIYTNSITLSGNGTFTPVYFGIGSLSKTATLSGTGYFKPFKKPPKPNNKIDGAYVPDITDITRLVYAEHPLRVTTIPSMANIKPYEIGKLNKLNDAYVANITSIDVSIDVPFRTDIIPSTANIKPHEVDKSKIPNTGPAPVDKPFRTNIIPSTANIKPYKVDKSKIPNIEPAPADKPFRTNAIPSTANIKKSKKINLRKVKSEANIRGKSSAAYIPTITTKN